MKQRVYGRARRRRLFCAIGAKGGPLKSIRHPEIQVTFYSGSNDDLPRVPNQYICGRVSTEAPTFDGAGAWAALAALETPEDDCLPVSPLINKLAEFVRESLPGLAQKYRDLGFVGSSRLYGEDDEE